MDILSYSFMQRAIIAGIIVALMCPMVGMFMVIRRQSLLGDGLGHIAFAGVTGASLLQLYPPLGAAVLTVGASVGIEFIRRRQNQYTDMILALFFYAGLAMAIIFSTLSKIPGTGLMNFLFGSILTVTVYDIANIVIIAIVTLIILYRLFPQLVITAFDEEIAKVAGVNTNRMNMVFAVLTALVIVVGMTIVGILLISALMIVPVATAHLWKKGFKQTMAISVLYAEGAVILGLTLAFYLNIASGGTIVMTAILFYAITFISTLKQRY